MPSTRSTGRTTKITRRSRTSAAVAATIASVRPPARGTATPAVAICGSAAITSPGRSAGREPAVDGQFGAGHVRGFVAGQEERDVGDLARSRDSTERNAPLEFLPERVGEIRRLERRVDDAGVDDVAAHAVPRELDGQRL